MSAVKRSLTNFEEFPGDIKNDIYTFPTLYYIDANNRKRAWSLFIRLINSGDMKKVKKINWELDEQRSIKIDKDFLSGDKKLPDKVVSELWTEVGIVGMKISRSTPTYFEKTMNIGRKNERSNFQTAMIAGRKKWHDKKEKGGMPEEEFEEQKKSGASGDNEKKYFAMLVGKFKEHKEKIEYPALIQPKLDGMRCIMFLDEGEVKLYSRNKKIIDGFELHKDEVYDILEKYYDKKNDESLYIDGEFYTHGKKLQEILSNIKDVKKNNDEKTSVVLNMFDCFYPSKTNVPFIERHKILSEIVEKNDLKWFTLVENKEVKDEEDVMKKFQEYVDEGYEGAIVKNKEAPYKTHNLWSTDKYIRSKEILKIKKQYQSEFKIVGFTEAKKGSHKGALMWILETNDGKEFLATPKDTTIKERQEEYKKMSENNIIFEKKYKNKMMTLDYEETSKSGVPLRANAIIVRDYE